MPEIKTILATIAIAVITLISAHGFDDNDSDQQRIKVTIVGAVFEQGTMKVPAGTSIETVLNRAGCHKGSFLRKIRVTRKSNDRKMQLTVSPSEGDECHAEPFALKDGDIISVPEILWNPEDAKIPRPVVESFVLKKTEVIENKKPPSGRDGRIAPATPPPAPGNGD